MIHRQFKFAVLATTFVSALMFQSVAAQDAAQKNTADKTEVKVGELAPNFELDSLDEKKVSLSDRRRDDKRKGKIVVLLFSRANW